MLKQIKKRTRKKKDRQPPLLSNDDDYLKYIDKEFEQKITFPCQCVENLIKNQTIIKKNKEQ
jgi:hypothetical protein